MTANDVKREHFKLNTFQFRVIYAALLKFERGDFFLIF